MDSSLPPEQRNRNALRFICGIWKYPSPRMKSFQIKTHSRELAAASSTRWARKPGENSKTTLGASGSNRLRRKWQDSFWSEKTEPGLRSNPREILFLWVEKLDAGSGIFTPTPPPCIDSCHTGRSAPPHRDQLDRPARASIPFAPQSRRRDSHLPFPLHTSDPHHAQQ